MAGIDAGEGAAAAAPPPEMTPAQRIQQVRRVVPALVTLTRVVRDPHPLVGPVRRWLSAGCCRPPGSRLVIGWKYAFLFSVVDLVGMCSAGDLGFWRPMGRGIRCSLLVLASRD